MTNPIKTHKEKCVGCHKCVHECPVNANIEDPDLHSSTIALNSIIEINDSRCIQCGACVKICNHNARYYVDDIDLFFTALADNKHKMAIITAPSFLYNFSGYKKVIGWFKVLGVEIIQDVSFGADITTYLYLKLYEQDANMKSYISQPCPVIVDYIKMYAPELIPYLSPYQSPAMCLAIWLRNYKNFKGKITFISPCIAKRVEFENNNLKYINYNLTITKLKEYIRKNNIDLQQYSEVDFDNPNPNLGYNFSRPGGLKENMEYYTDNEIWVKQIEGFKPTVEYIKNYKERISNGKKIPQLVDILNCYNGCNHGTGTDHDISLDDIDYTINTRKKQFIKRDNKANQLFKMFDEKLNPDDFIRKYDPKPVRRINRETTAYKAQVEEVYNSLGKVTEKQKNHNCNACGRGNCKKFAESVVDGYAMISSCFFHSQKMLHDIIG